MSADTASTKSKWSYRVAQGTVLGLSAIAAIVSYRHGYNVVLRHGEPPATAMLVPVAADGMIAMASLVKMSCATRSIRTPLLGHVALALGIAATVAVNILHGIEHGTIGAIVAAWPAITLAITLELFMKIMRSNATETATPGDATRSTAGQDRSSTATATVVERYVAPVETATATSVAPERSTPELPAESVAPSVAPATKRVAPLRVVSDATDDATATEWDAMPRDERIAAIRAMLGATPDMKAPVLEERYGMKGSTARKWLNLAKEERSA